MKQETKLDKFIIKDVRCFAGRQEFNIRPLTFLVGENSTGKSTILGCMQALSGIPARDLLFRRGEGIDFNIRPYQMGTYGDIARKERTNVKSFELGYILQLNEQENMELSFKFSERKKGSEPMIQKIILIFPEGKIILKKNIEKSKNEEVSIHWAEDENIFTVHLQGVNLNDIASDMLMGYPLERLLLHLLKEDHFLDKKQKTIPNLPELKKFIQTIQKYKLRQIIPPKNFHSFAPVRSKPLRTYNPVKESYDPEGEYIPMLLNNLYTSDKKRWRGLKAYLIQFGRLSGMFSDIDVRKFGESKGDPFRIKIKVRNSKDNLIDVGYGISQLLPILVEIVLNPHTTFLIQQPEVHLHPKAQAALASLFVLLAKQGGHNFIIETHSDYMVNRARIEIQNKDIDPEDVSLIYLEPDKDGVRVHNITFDEQANMTGVPDSYGDFFLKESDRLLGFSE